MLTAMLCVTSVSMAASAEREIPELEVQLLTDKENYSGNEEIAEIIQLYNPSSVSIEDIKIQTSVPEGYQIKNDWISSVAKMEAEETLQILEKIDAPTSTQAETFAQTDTKAGKGSPEETAEESSTDITPKTDSDAPAN